MEITRQEIELDNLISEVAAMDIDKDKIQQSCQESFHPHNRHNFQPDPNQICYEQHLLKGLSSISDHSVIMDSISQHAFKPAERPTFDCYILKSQIHLPDQQHTKDNILAYVTELVQDFEGFIRIR